MRIWSVPELLAQRRQGTIEQQVAFRLNGKTYAVPKRIVNGEMEAFELSKPIGEMLTSETSRKELLQKVVLDVELGRESVPLLYGPIYETLSDSNFPEVFDAKWAQHGVVVFLEHIEGEEVHFGSLAAEQGPTARIKGYAAGFEYTKELELFNQTFNLEILNRAFGEGHNAILNHVHLGPILTARYEAGNKTAAVYVDENDKALANNQGSHALLSMRATLRKAVKDTRTARRPGNVLLINSANEQDIKDAMQAFTIGATPYRSVEGITDIVIYDGWTVKVGKKDYSYAGVTAGKAYLVRPRKGFKSLVKQGLQINATMGDLTRLVESQIVGDFWMGVFAAITENVQEITLP